MFYAHLMNMHFLPHIYLLISLGLIAWRQLRSSLLPNCALYDRIAKENLSKISIKHVFSPIFSAVLELLQTVYREKTELQVVTNHSAHRWKSFPRSGSQELDHCSSAAQKFPRAGAKKAKSHINGCLVTLLLDLVFSVFISHKCPEHTFWTH